MADLDWIRELVKSEQRMEETGLVEVQSGDAERILLEQETVRFLEELKQEFVDAASAFNHLKASAIGRIKIYGVAQTAADFMLFRNGFKMIFSQSNPGQIRVKFNFIGTNFIPNEQDTASIEEDLIDSAWGPFQELSWLYQGQEFKSKALVKFYLSKFIRESAG